MEPVIIIIALVVIAAHLIFVMRSCDEKDSTCVQVILCADGKMICDRKPHCKAYKKVTRSISPAGGGLRGWTGGWTREPEKDKRSVVNRSSSLSFPRGRSGKPEKDKCSTNKSEDTP